MPLPNFYGETVGIEPIYKSLFKIYLLDNGSNVDTMSDSVTEYEVNEEFIKLKLSLTDKNFKKILDNRKIVNSIVINIHNNYDESIIVMKMDCEYRNFSFNGDYEFNGIIELDLMYNIDNFEVSDGYDVDREIKLKKILNR